MQAPPPPPPPPPPLPLASVTAAPGPPPGPPPEHRPKGLDEAIASVLQDIRRVHGQLGQALGSAAMKARAARGAEADRPRQFYYEFATLDYLYGEWTHPYFISIDE